MIKSVGIILMHDVHNQGHLIEIDYTCVVLNNDHYYYYYYYYFIFLLLFPTIDLQSLANSRGEMKRVAGLG